jgi:thiol-disulfide isomerase/thioredoxin
MTFLNQRNFIMAQTLIKDGLVAFVKRACPTCAMIAPQMAEVAGARKDFQVVTQDDANFPAGVANVIDDRELDQSWLNHIEVTPTLIQFAGGREVERVLGWDRGGWQRLTGIATLGGDLPALRPG